MIFSQSQIDQLVEHARDDLPNECCGVVSSADGVAVEVHRAINAAASPLRYEIDSKDFLTTEVAAWEQERNSRECKINWQFTTADARVKLKRLYPSVHD